MDTQHDYYNFGNETNRETGIEEQIAYVIPPLKSEVRDWLQEIFPKARILDTTVQMSLVARGQGFGVQDLDAHQIAVAQLDLAAHAGGTKDSLEVLRSIYLDCEYVERTANYSL